MLWQKPHNGGGTFDKGFTSVRADATIAANQFVIWDILSTGDNLGFDVIPGGAASQYGVGIAIQAAVQGDIILVQTYGVYKDALTDGSVAQGNQLEAGASGSLRQAAQTTITASLGVMDKYGVALATDVGTAGDVFLRCM